MFKCLFLLFICSLACIRAQAATYNVAPAGNDSNPGSKASPWASISHAASVAGAGDTVNVAAGTYKGNVTFSNSGSSSSVITFQGAGNPVIAGYVKISGSYILLSGFTVSPPVPPYVLNSAVNMGGSHITCSGVTVTNYGDGSISMAATQSTAISIEGSYNVYTGGSILNLDDIDVFHIWGHDQTISNNTVSNINMVHYAQNHTDFIQTWGLDPSQISYNVRIFGNLVENGTTDIGNTETDGNPNLHDWYIYNNIFYNIGSSFFTGLPNTWIFNNIFMLQGTGGGAVALMFYTDNAGTQSGGNTGYDYDSAGSKVINNAFIANSSDIGVGGKGGTLSTVTITNNYFASNTSYTAERSPTGTAYVNGGNPKFTNPTGRDFHISSGSALIGKGANLSSVFTIDKDLNERASTGAWDIGPYQYQSASITRPLHR